MGKRTNTDWDKADWSKIDQTVAKRMGTTHYVARGNRTVRMLRQAGVDIPYYLKRRLRPKARKVVEALLEDGADFVPTPKDYMMGMPPDVSEEFTGLFSICIENDHFANVADMSNDNWASGPVLSGRAAELEELAEDWEGEVVPVTVRVTRKMP